MKRLKRSLEIRQRESGMDSADSAEILRNIGVVNYKLGKYSASIRYFQDVLRI